MDRDIYSLYVTANKMVVLNVKWIAILNSEDDLKDRAWSHIQPDENRKAHVRDMIDSMARFESCRSFK